MLELQDILESLQKNKISVSKAQKLLSLHSIEKIENFAKIDIGRKKRRGIPEVIYAESKQLHEIKKIILRVLDKSNAILVSRITKPDYPKVLKFLSRTKFNVMKGKNNTTILVYKKKIKKTGGKVGILTAGTSDIGVAEEARLMCEAMNCSYICSYDVGVAGMHRIFPVLRKFVNEGVDVVIVVAGMEGALATLVTSTLDIPVIGVPTSVGYGYGEKGIAALASMLQSCTLGLSVVNIDNGIAAGAIGANIANKINSKKEVKYRNI